MNPAIERELEVLFGKADVEETIEAMARLKGAARKEDVPRLIDALRSEKNDFWTRELLAEPICEIGGPEFLPELFDALSKNYEDGHDNDSFAHFLVEMAEMQSEACRPMLGELSRSENPKHREYARWLLEFCK